MKTKAKVIAVVNQKGGVGKTTTTVALGDGLVKQGKKVLLIDLDPQASLTICMGKDNPDQIKRTISTLIKQLIMNEEIESQDEFVLTRDGIDFIPGNIELSDTEVNMISALSREHILKNILENQKEKYDYIIIDCCPTLGMLTVNALSAADEIIIPVTCEYLSAKGLELLLKNVLKVKRQINRKLKIAGILLTMYKQNMNLTKEVDEMIRKAYSDSLPIFQTLIPTSVKISEANMKNVSIYEYAPKNKAVAAYSEFVREVIEND